MCTLWQTARAQGLECLAERPVRGFWGAEALGGRQGAGGIDHQGRRAGRRQAHQKAAGIARIGGRRGLLFLPIGKAVVVVIRVGGVPQAIPVGILGLTWIGREGIKEIDDPIAICIRAIRARALEYLQGGDAVQDIEAVAHWQ